MLAMMTLTAIVWFYMYARRIPAILRFYSYAGAAMVLWFMLGRALITEFAVYV
jgi:hypothetical protein